MDLFGVSRPHTVVVCVCGFGLPLYAVSLRSSNRLEGKPWRCPISRLPKCIDRKDYAMIDNGCRHDGTRVTVDLCGL